MGQRAKRTQMDPFDGRTFSFWRIPFFCPASASVWCRAFHFVAWSHRTFLFLFSMFSDSRIDSVMIHKYPLRIIRNKLFRVYGNYCYDILRYMWISLMARMIIHVFHETFIRVLISHFIDISVFHRFSAHACVHSHLDLYHICTWKWFGAQ